MAQSPCCKLTGARVKHEKTVQKQMSVKGSGVVKKSTIQQCVMHFTHFSVFYIAMDIQKYQYLCNVCIMLLLNSCCIISQWPAKQKCKKKNSNDTKMIRRISVSLCLASQVCSVVR